MRLALILILASHFAHAIEKDSRRSFTFAYAPEVYSYKFTPQAGEEPAEYNAIGHNASLTYDYWVNKRWGFESFLSHRFFFFNELSNNTFPDSLAGNSLSMGLDFKLKVFKNELYQKGASLLAGYRFSLLDAELTIPLRVSDYQSHFFGVGFLYQWSFGKGRRLDFRNSLYFSFAYDEEPQTSGDLDEAFLVESQLKYLFAWNEEWDIFFAYKFALHQVNLKGIGTRGSQEVEQKETVHSPTIGLIYAF